MNKEFLNPPELPNWEQTFSQVVIVPNNGTRTIYVAGQVSVDKEKNLIGEGNLKVQAEQTFRNLALALASAGATTADVVKVNIYVKHYIPADATIITSTLRKAFPHLPLPAGTWLGVETLAQEGFLIEVDAIAIVESR